MNEIISILSLLVVLVTLSISFFFSFKRVEMKSKKLQDSIEEKELELELINSQLQKKDGIYRNRQKLLSQIISCANNALRDDQFFQNSMQKLADFLRDIFKSEYCSIGTVVNGDVEDHIISVEPFKNEQKLRLQLNNVEKVSIARIDDDLFVCKALNSRKEQYLYHEFSKNENSGSIQHSVEYNDYILPSGKLSNTSIIPIRDTARNNYGYLQFINSERRVTHNDISPFSDALLQLVQMIINSKKKEQERKASEQLRKDLDFFREIQGESKTNTIDIDELLENIMRYLSEAFNAAIISFRTPVLNGPDREPLFLLRECYTSNKIHRSEALKDLYKDERLIKRRDEIGGIDKIRCINHDNIIDIVKAKDNNYYSKFHLDGKLYDDTVIVPILRDDERSGICLNAERMKANLEPCSKDREEGIDCVDKFRKMYGFFKLRIFKPKDKSIDSIFDDSNGELVLKEEARARLLYLSRHVAMLLNSIVDKYENKSLSIFQEELKDSSFIKMIDFDNRCIDILIKSVHAESSSIYRFDERKKTWNLSATNINDSSITSELNEVMQQVREKKKAIYYWNLNKNFKSKDIKSVMALPMLSKDDKCIGVILLVGKSDLKHCISKVYWEHDKLHIGYIVNVLTRISLSDTERLTFLAQLSHELLKPVTELVYENDFSITTAKRNKEQFTKEQLISKLQDNMDRCFLFKYIINDVESIYSLSKERNVPYNIVKQEEAKQILLEAIRLLEKDAHSSKGIGIVTYVSQMPTLYFDKERMMQVFINLLKNAIRYSNGTKDITVSYNFVNGSHEICFSNTGIGITEEEKEHIFELFYRGSDAKKIVSGGTGMGLFIVKEIMEAHGGECIVGSPKDPTEFVLRLPNIK